MKPHDKRSKATPRPRGGTLLGILIGVVIGVLIALGVVWYVNKTPLPFQEKTGRPADAGQAERIPGAADQPPAMLPGKPGDKPVDRPRFDFYKILPGGEATPAPNAAVTPDGGQAAPVEQFYLQLGAFQKPTEADNLKARLALMGVEASVQEVNIPGKGVIHRVRAGPYARPEDMNRTRNQLAQNGIVASVVKLKTADPEAAKP